MFSIDMNLGGIFMKKNIMKTLTLSMFMLVASNSIIAQTKTDADLEASIQRGKQVAQVCVACHGENFQGIVVSEDEVRPRLTGLNKDYLKHQIESFKNNSRESIIMSPMAGILDDAKAEDVFNYIASLPVIKDTKNIDESLLAKGKKLVYEGDWDRNIPPCMGCHGLDAYGVGSTFPNINGQSSEYIKAQIKSWKDGKRNNDTLHLMKTIASYLEEDDINAVAAWLASQPAKRGE